MLLRQSNGVNFTTGRAKFLDQSESSQGTTAKIWVRIEPASFGHPILAQLDTGAAWSILDAEVANELSLFDGDGQLVTISTRLGEGRFTLKRIPVQILADDGESLSVDATVAVWSEWHHGTFIGYPGLLERIRFAVDPFDNYFYFGPA